MKLTICLFIYYAAEQASMLANCSLFWWDVELLTWNKMELKVVLKLFIKSAAYVNTKFPQHHHTDIKNMNYGFDLFDMDWDARLV